MSFKWEKIRDRCRKGIPHSLRSQAWFYLCGAHLQKRRFPYLYRELLTKEISDNVKNDIVKDLDRQFPLHELYANSNSSGQADLYSILKAFAVYRPKVGYCQAQGPIAAVLLMYMPAEHAFWCLVALNDYYIGGYFVQNLEEIAIHGHMLFAFLKKYSPAAHKLLVSELVVNFLLDSNNFVSFLHRKSKTSTPFFTWPNGSCASTLEIFPGHRFYEFGTCFYAKVKWKCLGSLFCFF